MSLRHDVHGDFLRQNTHETNNLVGAHHAIFPTQPEATQTSTSASQTRAQVLANLRFARHGARHVDEVVAM